MDLKHHTYAYYINWQLVREGAYGTEVENTKEIKRNGKCKHYYVVFYVLNSIDTVTFVIFTV